jgi:hypothetical protein
MVNLLLAVLLVVGCAQKQVKPAEESTAAETATKAAPPAAEPAAEKVAEPAKSAKTSLETVTLAVDGMT